MNFRNTSVATLCLLFTALTFSPAPAALAQHEAGQIQGPSKYLFLNNVELKPNQDGPYAKLEADEVQALSAANAPGHYLGMWAITGPNHVIFTSGFDSFAEAQKNHETIWSNAKLAATLNADNAAEAPLIASTHSSIYEYEPDLSLNAPLDLSKQRFMRILLFHVRNGHDQEFEHVVKLFAKAYQSSIPEARWAMFEKIYGEGSDNIYILVTPMESLSVVDDMHANGKKFRTAVGEDQLAVLRKALDASVKSSEADLFAIGSKISYVPQSWITSSPDFWGKK
ncbi:MAG TPA: hypothetical protein VME86_05355 [Acidobacteriaceae bacterium]|nr:hypothetical protein [Acidobacteriaceae bacterium]